MNILKHILFQLIVLLGLFQTKLETKTISIENEIVESLSEQSFHTQTQETQWLGLLYLQEESHGQSQYFSSNFSTESLAQNFSDELCSKSSIKNFEASFQISGDLESHLENVGWNEDVFHGHPELVDGWKGLINQPDWVR